MTTNEKALMLHKQWNGKLETISKTPVKSREDLALAYTPGVAEPCKVIAENKERTENDTKLIITNIKSIVEEPIFTPGTCFLFIIKALFSKHF